MKALIQNRIAGLLLIAVGLLMYWRETAVPPIHAGHVYAFIGMIAIGFLTCFPPIVGVVKQVVVIVAPYLPMVGGKRAGDPPATPPAAGAP